MKHLVEGNVVTILLESEGAAADVEQHLEFGAGKHSQQFVKYLVRNWRVIGKLETGKEKRLVARRWG
jgi:hypothetical protein